MNGVQVGAEEIRYEILKLLERDPEMSQRQLAVALGVSLGKANFCLNALIDRGLVKVRNFTSNPSKKGYMYILTPKGIEEKAKITLRFLAQKRAEYDAIRREIEVLSQEVAKQEVAKQEAVMGSEKKIEGK